MVSTIKVDNIQNASGTAAITIDSNGFPLPKAMAFSATKSAAQSISSGTWTKITFDTEEFDTGNMYDASTSKFQPSIAGYYHITCSVAFMSGVGNATLSRVYKNGSWFRNGFYFYHTQSHLDDIQGYTAMTMYLNGTDYVEIYGLGIGITTIAAGTDYSVFQGHLIGT